MDPGDSLASARPTGDEEAHRRVPDDSALGQSAETAARTGSADPASADPESADPGSADPESADPGSDIFDEILAQYVQQCERGEAPDRQAWLERYPAYAAELADFFRHRDRVEALMRPLRDVAQRVLNVRCPQCRQSVELVEEAKLSSLTCKACGSQFSLVPPESELPWQQIGHFQLLTQVGSGQFGTVWKARDLALERTVAVKIPRRRQATASDIEVFLRDARVAAQLNHPHIVSVHEVGKHEDVIYIVSDFVDGESLRERLQRASFSILESMQLCVMMADALHYAHEAGVVHRDFKPGNVMLDQQGIPHLVDFGLAKRDVGEVTMTLAGQILGTPAYMSPEQARGDGHDVDCTSDVYALGVVLYELLTGELPFRGGQRMLLEQILHHPPPSPRKLNNLVPRDVETICLKCLEKEPRNRYRTARDLADDCRRFLAGQPVAARPISLAARSLRWCRRNRLVATLAFLVVGLLISVATVAVIGWGRTQRALELARQRADEMESNLYFSEMVQASHAALDPNGLTEIQRHVTRWEPPKTPRDRRGWEWYYLESLTELNLATLRHDGGVVALAWNPQGTHLASAGMDQSLRIWEPSGKVSRAWPAHQALIRDLGWSQDGKWLASASQDGTVGVWQVASEREVARLTLSGHAIAVTFSPDGRWLATAERTTSNPSLPRGIDARLPVSSTIRIWDTLNWTTARQFELPDATIEGLRWHPQLDQLVVALSDGPLQIRDAQSGEILERIGDSELRAYLVAWSPDGRRLAYSKRGSAEASVWDLEQQKNSVVPAPSMVGALAWHPTRPLLVLTGGNKEILFHDLGSSTQLPTIQGHTHRVSALSWNPRGTRLATGAVDGEIKIWPEESSSSLSTGSAVVAWHPQRNQYASRLGRQVVVVDTEDRAQAPRLLPPHPYDIVTVAWNHAGTQIAALSYDGVVRVSEVASGRLMSESKTNLPIIGSRLPRLLAWSPDDSELVMPWDANGVRIVDARTGQVRRDISTDLVQVNSIAWHPRRELVAVSGDSRGIRIYDSGRGTVVYSLPDIPVSCLAWSPDGREIAAAQSDYGALLWKPNEAEPVRYLLGHRNWVHSVAYSPDGQRLAAADQDGTLCVWDVSSGKLATVLKYASGVPDIGWSASSSTLAAVAFGGADTVQLWKSTRRSAPDTAW